MEPLKKLHNLQYLPIGIQTFETLRENNYLYVDKTEYYHRLLTLGSRFTFFSRPRRFGKSLMLSTLKAIFEGKKALFKGLWIENKIEWAPKPVIYIDFNAMNFRNNTLEAELDKTITEQAQHHGIALQANDGAKAKFTELLQKLGSAVVLIDEYDKPITDFLGEPQAEQHLGALKNFYGALKSQDAYVHFCMLTGVSKFGKISIFSDLNNLQDLSLSPLFANMLGITQEELDHNFQPYINQLVRNNQLDINDLKQQLKKWYNGYSWDAKHTLYCPFSLLNYFSAANPTGAFHNYWFETGTPTFLTKRIREEGFLPNDLEWREAGFSTVQGADLSNVGITGLLLQTGYLTIKEQKTLPNGSVIYTLGYPNEEVRQSFNTHLFAEYAQTPVDQVEHTISAQMRHQLQQQNWPAFIQTLNSALANIAHHIYRPGEDWFHAMTHLALTLTGLQAISEYSTFNGRIDDVLFDGQTIFIFEYKMDKSANAAFEQIAQKQYALPFQTQGKKIIGIGINFSSATKSITDWVAHPIDLIQTIKP